MKSFLQALAATLIGLVAALLLTEGAVRLLFDEPVQPRYVVDPGYGVRANQVNVRTRHYVPGDYDIAMSTNSAGMRGQREYPVERVAGKRRILVLGDSFAFGYGCEDDEVVSAQLESLLNARQPDSAEVINLAVSGFGQAEQLVTWENKARAYRPDVVVLFYFDNDIGNNAVSKLYKLVPDGTAVRDAAAYLPGSKLQEQMFAFAPTRFLFEHSEAWNLIRNKLSSIVQKRLLTEQGLDTFDDTTTFATELTRALLRQFVAAVRADGAQPVLVVIPSRGELQSNFPLAAAELAALGVPLLDGREFVTREDYYVRDSHWRPSGHRKAAEQLVRVLDSLPAPAAQQLADQGPDGQQGAEHDQAPVGDQSHQHEEDRGADGQ